jgi:hypothetical protein
MEFLVVLLPKKIKNKKIKLSNSLFRRLPCDRFWTGKIAMADAAMTCPARQTARWFESQGSYLYHFEHRPNFPPAFPGQGSWMDEEELRSSLFFFLLFFFHIFSPLLF